MKKKFNTSVLQNKLFRCDSINIFEKLFKTPFERVICILEDTIGFFENVKMEDRAGSIREVIKYIVSGSLYSFDKDNFGNESPGYLTTNLEASSIKKKITSKFDLVDHFTKNPVRLMFRNSKYDLSANYFKPSLKKTSKNLKTKVANDLYFKNENQIITFNFSQKSNNKEEEIILQEVAVSKGTSKSINKRCELEKYSDISDDPSQPRNKLEGYFINRYIQKEQIDSLSESATPETSLMNNLLKLKNKSTPRNQTHQASKALTDSLRIEDLYVNKIGKNLVETITNRNFDIRRFTKNYSLPEASFIVVSSVICLLNLTHKFSMNKLQNFNDYCTLSYNKRELPYHNLKHSLDVFHFLYIVLTYSYSLKIFHFTEVDAIAVIMAGLLHDFGHTGFNNDFHIKTISEIAVDYNNQSVTQNFHSMNASKIFLNPRLNILNKLNTIEFKLFRKRLIESILATDMAGHTRLISLIKGKFNFYKIKLGSNTNLLVNINKPDYIEEQQELINFIIHIADFSFTTKPFVTSSKWTYELFLEFWNQGKYESILGLEKSVLCDRVSTSIPSAQISFISGIAIPSFSLLLDIVPTLSYLKTNLKANLERWEYLERKEGKEDDSAEENDDSEGYSEDERNLKKYNIASYNLDPTEQFAIYFNKIT